eukprot:PhM_4_TR10506/c0_g1_i1/m.106161
MTAKPPQENTMKSVDIVTSAFYTVPFTPPNVLHGKISKRQMSHLPNYTCHTYSQHHHALFAGRQNGDVLKWSMNNKKPGRRDDSKATRQMLMSGNAIPLAKDDRTSDKYTLLGTHKGGVTCIAEHGERFIFTGSYDTTIRVWDVTLGLGDDVQRCVQTIPAHDATVTALASHCNVVISVSCDCTLKVWSEIDGRDGLAYPWYVARQMFVFDTWATCLYAPLKKMAEDTQGEIFVGDANGGVTVLKSIVAHSRGEDYAISKLELVRHTPGVRSQGIIRIIPVATLNVVMTLSYDDTVRLSDVTSNSLLVNIYNPNAGIRFVDMSWDPLHEELFLVDAESHVMLWDSKSNKMLGFGEVKLAPTGCSYVNRSSISVSSAECVSVLNIVRCIPSVKQRGHDGRIISVMSTFSKEDNGGIVITVGSDNTINLWQLEEKLIQLHTFPPLGDSEITSFCIMPEYNLYFSGHDDGTLKVRSRHIKETSTSPAHGNTVTAIATGKERCVRGEWIEQPHLVTVSFDGHLAVWDVLVMTSHSWSLRGDGKVRVSNSELLSVIVDDLKREYVCGGNEGDVSFWSMKDLTLLRHLRGPFQSIHGTFGAHTEGVTSLALDGNVLFTAGEDQRIIMWDTISGNPIHIIDEYEADAVQLQILPDNGNLVSSLRDGTVHVWSQTCREDVALYESSLELSAMCSMRSPTDLVVCGTEEGEVLRVYLPLGGTQKILDKRAMPKGRARPVDQVILGQPTGFAREVALDPNESIAHHLDGHDGQLCEDVPDDGNWVVDDPLSPSHYHHAPHALGGTVEEDLVGDDGDTSEAE